MGGGGGDGGEVQKKSTRGKKMLSAHVKNAGTAHRTVHTASRGTDGLVALAQCPVHMYSESKKMHTIPIQTQACSEIGGCILQNRCRIHIAICP